MRFHTASRVVVPVAAVSLLLLIVGVSGAWYVQRLQRQTSELLNRNVASIRAAEELEVYLLRIRFELNQFLIGGDPVELAQAIAMQHDVEDWLARANELAESPQEESALAEIHRGLIRLFTELKQIATVTDAGSAKQQVETLVDQVLSEEILPPASEFLDINEEELEASSRENQQLADRLVLALLLLGTCGAIAGIIAGYGMARGISRSILQLSLPIRDVAGQLSEVVETISVSSDPGLEDLELVLNAVSKEVESVISQLHERQREVLHADQLAAIGQLAAGLAHEVRNPLMCMSVLVQSALSDPDRTLDERDLQVLNDEIARLDRLLQQFLDFARSSDRAVTETDFREAVEQTVELLLAKAKQLDINIDVVVTSDPVLIRADPTQLRQLVLNLLLNSIDASSPEGHIAITLSMDDDDRQQCRLTVEDEGHGLPSEAVDRIFEPFFSTKESGLGMGLAICRRIVNEHHGEITAANRPGGGTLFSVRLPTPDTTVVRNIIQQSSARSHVSEPNEDHVEAARH